MIIILEGADLVGKTSVAEKLNELTGIPQTSIWVDLETPRPAVISVAKTILLIAKSLKPTIIFDRSFISEYVYGNILGRDTSYIPKLIEEWGHLKECYLIIITADEKVLRERYQLRGDCYVDINKIVKINQQYEKLHMLTSNYIPTYYFDSSYKEVECLAKEILESLNCPISR